MSSTSLGKDPVLTFVCVCICVLQKPEKMQIGAAEASGRSLVSLNKDLRESSLLKEEQASGDAANIWYDFSAHHSLMEECTLDCFTLVFWAF